MHNNSDYYSNSLMIFVDPNSILEGKAQYFNLPTVYTGLDTIVEQGMSVDPAPLGTDVTTDLPFLTGDETYSVETTKQTDQAGTTTIPTTTYDTPTPGYGPGFGGTGY
jgi:hypothetical protein